MHVRRYNEFDKQHFRLACRSSSGEFMLDIEKKEDIMIAGTRLVFGLVFPEERVDDLDDFTISQRLICQSIGLKTTMKVGKKVSWYIDADPYIRIQQDGDRQRVLGKKNNPNLSSTYFFVRLHGVDGGQEFFKVSRDDLQEIILQVYEARLKKHNGVRPRNPLATTISLKQDLIQRYKVEPGESIPHPLPREQKDWSREECLLAIWAYSTIDRDRDIRKADVYAEVAGLIPRSQKAIEYKVQNVSACDPRPREEKPISEKSNYQNILKELFEKFGRDHELLDVFYQQYVDGLELGDPPKLNGKNNDVTRYFTEGRLVESKGFRRSRSGGLRDAARKHYRDVQGSLACCACGAGFDDLIHSGKIEHEIIEMHHLKLVAESELETQDIATALSNIVPVCPTCHSMIHSSNVAMTLDQLRSMLAEQATATNPRG
jgi:hypothetical protein